MDRSCQTLPDCLAEYDRLSRHISSRYYLSSRNQAHSKASLIKVVDIFKGDAILHLDLL
jgi:hypothetical protein